MKPHLLAIGVFPEFLLERLRQGFEVHAMTAAELPETALREAGEVRAIAALGESVADRRLLDLFPAVEIIGVYGVGYDGIDVATAAERKIAVTHTPDVLTEDVADFALGLMLAVARKIAESDRFVRRGAWSKQKFPLGARVNGARLGIVGLGRIGRAVATRAAAFGMTIAYTDLRSTPGAYGTFYPSAAELAGAVDYLVVSTYGGASTRKLIGAEVLKALGSRGFLINVSRGSVVDEEALVRALASGEIAGAALDVFEDEPNVRPELVAMENVVLSPHIASGTAETRAAMADLVVANFEAHFAGRPLLTPVPAS
jgi:hydroxypyruvate reductase